MDRNDSDFIQMIQDQRGFSLVEVIIAAAVALLLALALAQILRNASQSENQLKVKQEANNLRQELRYERATNAPPAPDP